MCGWENWGTPRGKTQFTCDSKVDSCDSFFQMHSFLLPIVSFSMYLSPRLICRKIQLFYWRLKRHGNLYQASLSFSNVQYLNISRRFFHYMHCHQFVQSCYAFYSCGLSGHLSKYLKIIKGRFQDFFSSERTSFLPTKGFLSNDFFNPLK